MEDNTEFSTDDLANQLCMNRSNLYLKMNSIAEISYMTGFSSPSYLSDSLKRYMGMLPSEYIKEHRNNR
ncbi:helix-turn-helix domain-containing protein [Bacteroides clarus]|uniref:helix-turn-helix domain-containing protein n=1 Tax=Bacteroides clarus TaxID=626929 RepID=UPI00345FB91B